MPLSAAAPIVVDGVARGAVLLEQNADQMLALRTQAFARLDEHTQYLRTLGGKLSHELRTPLRASCAEPRT